MLEAASSWRTVWKPFLSESIGWFIGAFLIVAGTFYWVAESWSSMTSVTRSLAVFALAAGYSAGFAAWSRFLDRREATRGAARVLALIGAVIAPLAAVALNPKGGELSLAALPALYWPLLGGWALAAAFLSRKPAESYEPGSARRIQLAVGATTLLLGAAPLVAVLGPAALWLDLLPAAFAFWSAGARRERSAEQKAFALLAPAYLAALFGIRLHLALSSAGNLPPLGTYAPFLAVLAASALRAWPTAPHRAADAVRVGVAGGMVALGALAAFGQPPAFFFTALIATLTLAWMARGGPRLRARWTYGAYAYGYLAFQTCNQLIPGIVRELLREVKRYFGYGVAPLPANYGGVNATIFIAALGIVAARLSRASGRKREVGEALLGATAVASVLFGLLSVFGADQRPALMSLPVLAGLNLWLGAFSGRRLHTYAGALLAALLPISLALYLPAPWAALAAASVALCCAVLSVPMARAGRWAYSVSAWLGAALAVALAWQAEGAFVPAAALTLAAIASLLAARNLDQPLALGASAALLPMLAPRALFGFAPELAPLALAGSSLALALLADRGGRLRLLTLASTAAALLAPILQLVAQGDGAPVHLGPVLLASSAALFVHGRCVRPLRVPAVVFACAALLPWLGPLSPWPWMTPLASASACAAAALAASIWSALYGRSLVPALFASLSCAVAAVAAGASTFEPAVLAVCAAGAVLSARALHPSFSVPWAAALSLGSCLASDELRPWCFLALAAALTALSLFEEWDFTWRALLGRKPVAMAASLSALAVVLGTCAGARFVFRAEPWHLAVLLSLPLLWMRATRAPAFAAIPVAIAAFYAAQPGAHPALAWLVPSLAVVLSRVLWHLPAAARALFGERHEDKARAASSWLIASLGLCGMWLLSLRADAALAGGLAAAMALLAGGPLAIRLGIAAAFAAAAPQTQLPTSAALLAVGFAAHHWRGQAQRVLAVKESSTSRVAAGASAVALALWHCWADHYSPEAFAAAAVAVMLCAFLVSRRWLLTVSVVFAGVAAALLFELSPLEPGHAQWVGLAAACAAAALRHERVGAALGRVSRALTPGLEGSAASPLWLGGATWVGVALAWRWVGIWPSPGLLLLAAAAVLLWTPNRVQAASACALLAGSLALAAPLAWWAPSVAALGVALCLSGRLLAPVHRVSGALHHCGWAISLLALLGLRSLGEVQTPLAFAACALAAWAVAYRRSALEPIGWLATLMSAHVALMHLGIWLSTGMPATYILPYLGGATALLSTAAFAFAKERWRKALGGGFAALAMLELVAGLALMRTSAPTEAWVALGCLAVLLGALVFRSVREGDETAGYLSQLSLVLGYLVVRLHLMGAHSLGAADAVAALLGGSVLSGLYLFARREGERFRGLARPLLFGAFLLPLAGLLAAPWRTPLLAALILVGHAAHFAALASSRSLRRVGSLLSAGAFNAALLCGWLGTSTTEPQYFVIPAGVSVLLLVRAFRADLSAEAQARLRGVAITAIYAAAAWRPLTFEASWAMLLCALVCVVGVAAGVALRIRSYVYLGTAFLVTTVSANLIRYGVRDPRLGALFLSALGLAVVGFMVLFTAQRAELLRRYHRVRQMLEQWDG